MELVWILFGLIVCRGLYTVSCRNLVIFWKVIEGTLDKVVERYKPDAIVCQCGADGVSGDPHQVNFHQIFIYFPNFISFSLTIFTVLTLSIS